MLHMNGICLLFSAMSPTPNFSLHPPRTTKLYCAQQHGSARLESCRLLWSSACQRTRTARFPASYESAHSEQRTGRALIFKDAVFLFTL